MQLDPSGNNLHQLFERLLLMKITRFWNSFYYIFLLHISLIIIIIFIYMI